MRLQAAIHQQKMLTKHYLAVGVDNDTPDGLKAMPVASTVEIVEETNGFYLFRYDDTGQFAGDSWFPTIDACKKQALFEFAIEDADWSLVDDSNSS